MSTLNLRTLERKNWRLASQDGLLDVLFGMIFLAAAVVAVLDQTDLADAVRIAVMLCIQFGGAGVILWIRMRFTRPRIGRVRYGASRVSRVRTLHIVLALCVVVTVVLVVLTSLSNRIGAPLFEDVTGVGAWLVITAVVFVPIAAIAYVLEYPRLLLYAALLSAAEYLHIVLKLPSIVPYSSAYAYGGASLVALTIGVVTYVRFVRRYPRQPAVPTEPGIVMEEAPDE